jgi:hypothetical protein
MNESNILIYTNKNGDIKVDVKLEDKNIWLSQAQLCEVFQKSKSTISEHISNIFKEEELDALATVRKFRTVQMEGQREVARDIDFYNLDLIIAVGFRVKSPQGTQFRMWATKKLNEYITKGFVLNDDRFKNADSMVYFEELQNRLREIRISERFFYQKIKDIYTTSIDYSSKDEQTVKFFKIIQNKLLWAISSKTASELIHSRVDSKLPLLGMQFFDKKTAKSIIKKDVNIAKNYLNEDEIKLLGLLTEQYLAFAETMAQQQTPMYMKDWIQRLDSIISLNGRELLDNAGKISREMADEKSYIEYDKYKKEQLHKQNIENFNELEEDMKKLT